jgi:hypothetical protein
MLGCCLLILASGLALLLIIETLHLLLRIHKRERTITDLNCFIFLSQLEGFYQTRSRFVKEGWLHARLSFTEQRHEYNASVLPSYPKLRAASYLQTPVLMTLQSDQNPRPHEDID